MAVKSTITGSVTGGALSLAGAALSTGAVTAAAGGAAASAAGTSAATVAPLGAAGPVGWVALAATGVMALVKMIFHGADPRQVPASQVEQAFEAAADDIWAAGNPAQGKMLSQAQAIAGMEQVLNAGLKYYASAEVIAQCGQRNATNGANNMRDKAIGPMINKVKAMKPFQATAPLDLTTARKFYITGPTGKGHWYKESLDAGATLADEYLNSLKPVQTTAPTVSKAAAPTVSAPVLAGGISGGWMGVLAVVAFLLPLLILHFRRQS